jgi:manganese efflux pump family protein
LDFGDLLLVSFAISLDNLAATLALGSRTSSRRRLPVALIFAFWGGLFPIVGILLGRTLLGAVETYATLVGSATLVLLGAWIIVSALRGGSGARRKKIVGSFYALAMLGMTLSLDNLVVGVALGLHGAAPLVIGILVASMVFLSSLTGLIVGRKGFERWGVPTEIAAGLLLITIGVALNFGWL